MRIRHDQQERHVRERGRDHKKPPEGIERGFPLDTARRRGDLLYIFFKKEEVCVQQMGAEKKAINRYYQENTPQTMFSNIIQPE